MLSCLSGCTLAHISKFLIRFVVFAIKVMSFPANIFVRKQVKNIFFVLQTVYFFIHMVKLVFENSGNTFRRVLSVV